MDISHTLVPKSDQLNADDLIAGPLTITVRGVSPGSTEQPVIVKFEGDDGRPYKPCKSMRRLLAHAWGTDGHEWIGRGMTLYHDPSVVFGGIKVGGIRISHLSHIDRELEVALTVTKGKKALYRVRPLRARNGQSAPSPAPADANGGTGDPQGATAEPPPSVEPAAGGAQPGLFDMSALDALRPESAQAVRAYLADMEAAHDTAQHWAAIDKHAKTLERLAKAYPGIYADVKIAQQDKLAALGGTA